MTGNQLARAIAALHWSNRILAGELGCGEKQVRLWRLDRSEIPPAVAGWMAALVAAHRAHPPPKVWRAERVWPEEAA